VCGVNEMITEIMQSNSVEKLKGILKSRYGLGLKVVSMVDSSTIDMTLQRAVLQNGSLQIPIISRDKYLGLAVMDGAHSITEGDQHAVSEIVRLVLEPALYSFYLKRQLETSAVQVLPDNVISLQNYSGKTTSISKDDQWLHNRPEFSSSIILLESGNPHKTSRVALQIHEIGERWALVNFKEMRENIKNIQDLRSLGPMTLFVDDVLVLNQAEQQILAEFSLEANPMTEPLILIGSTKSILDLMDQRQVTEVLAHHLMRNRIELDRLPMDFPTMREALELLLDRKALLN
jgi:hypothetical protein